MIIPKSPEEDLKELEDEYQKLTRQYDDVILAEEQSASDAYQKINQEGELLKRKYDEMQNEIVKAQRRWEEASKEQKKFQKQLENLEGNINKIRKKLNMEEIGNTSKDSEMFKIFPKDHYPDDEKEKSEKEKKLFLKKTDKKTEKIR